MKPEQMDFFGPQQTRAYTAKKDELRLKAAKFLDVKVLSSPNQAGENQKFLAKTTKQKLKMLLKLLSSSK